MSAEILKKIPKLPGIYVFKNARERIIYIGKAKELRKRVSSYFKKTDDWKVLELVKEHASIDYIVTKTEAEALLLEAQLIKKFKPKFNVLLTSGNPFVYLMVSNETIPQLKFVRDKKEKGTYFGPFIYKQKVRSVYEYIMRTFKLKLCKHRIDNGCLEYHLGRCAGSCLSTFPMADYRTRLLLAQNLLEDKYEESKQLLKEQIVAAIKELAFEKAQNLSFYLTNLESIFTILKTGFTEHRYDKEVTAVTLSSRHKVERPLQALEELQLLLKLDKKPQSIDCFDISHFQSQSIVGSCVRFTHGIPDKQQFRRFQIKTLTQQNDYAALQEIVRRRYRDMNNLPDVVLIDGGKGQLSAIKAILPTATVISLAKREERIYSEHTPEGYKLDIQTNMGQLLIAIRDYAHHFAVSYHKLKRSKKFIDRT